MSRQILMSFLKSVVLLNVVKIVTADDDRPLHLHLLDNPSQNTTSNADIASEGALLVDVVSIDGLDVKAVGDGVGGNGG